MRLKSKFLAEIPVPQVMEHTVEVVNVPSLEEQKIVDVFETVDVVDWRPSFLAGPPPVFMTARVVDAPRAAGTSPCRIRTHLEPHSAADCSRPCAQRTHIYSSGRNPRNVQQTDACEPPRKKQCIGNQVLQIVACCPSRQRRTSYARSDAQGPTPALDKGCLVWREGRSGTRRN